MSNDAKLLQSYVGQRDEAAFRELVERHLPTVYSVALRQVAGDRHLAEDVVQNVFRDLARDAADLSPNVVVAGWLYRTTQFAAAKAVRAEKRRRTREAAAAVGYDSQVMNSNADDPFDDLETFRIQLDQAMNELGEKDRNAILLRFFQGLDFRAVGVELNVTDDTAQKRVTRALERLRRMLLERGVALSVTVLGTLIANKAVAAPPEGLAEAITGSVNYTIASGGATVSGGFFAKIGAALRRPKAAGSAGAMAIGGIAAVLLAASPSPQIMTYDLSRDFPAAVNATSVWSFGWTPALDGTFTRVGHLKRYRSDNGAPLVAWQINDTNLPGAGRSMGTNIAMSADGRFVGPPGTIWFGPGIVDSARNFGVIRFTVPPGGRASYRLTAAICSLFDGPRSKEIEFHVLKNRSRLFSRLLGPNGSAAYSDVMKLYPGDTVDFLAGGDGSQREVESGLKIRATLTTDLAAPREDLQRALAVAPLILSPLRNQNEPAGASAGFEVAVAGSLPRHYQWWFGSSPIPGATNQTLLLSEIGAEHVGPYRVTVSNAAGAVTSSVARLTITACTPIPTGLLGWWSAEGSAGDRFGGHHGTRLAGTSFAPGRDGRAFLFQGEAAGIVIPYSEDLDVGSDGGFTVEAWIKPATVAGKLPLVAWNSETSQGAHLSILSGRLYANLRDEHGGSHPVTSSAGTITANQWQHVAFTYDPKTQGARLFCDGKIVADEHTEEFVPNTKLDLQLGRRHADNTLLTYSGLLDEISLYRRALSSEEIAAIASAGGAGKCVSRATGFSKK